MARFISAPATGLHPQGRTEPWFSWKKVYTFCCGKGVSHINPQLFPSMLCKDSKYINFPNHREKRLGKRKEEKDKVGGGKVVAFAISAWFFEKWKPTIWITNKQTRNNRQDRCRNYTAQIEVKIIQMLWFISTWLWSLECLTQQG